MPALVHTEIFSLPKQALYEIVIDIEKYPEFLPWCQGATILEETSTYILADLCVGVGSFKETFRSHVSLTPYSCVTIHSEDSSLHSIKHLIGQWFFEEEERGSTRIQFRIEFSFHSWFLNRMMERIFDHASHLMIHAFKKRSHLYTLHA